MQRIRHGKREGDGRERVDAQSAEVNRVHQIGCVVGDETDQEIGGQLGQMGSDGTRREIVGKRLSVLGGRVRGSQRQCDLF